MDKIKLAYAGALNKVSLVLLIWCIHFSAHAQKVGIGTNVPATKLDLRGLPSNPAIPGFTSSAIFRIGVSADEGIDFGKMITYPYLAWMQAGYSGSTADPLNLQPMGGNVGIGSTNAVTALDIRGHPGNPTYPGSTSTGMLRIGYLPTDGLDIGKMNVQPFSAWMQSGTLGQYPNALSLQPLGGSVAIGTAEPNLSAALDINSSTQGLLPPRLTFAERNEIVNPAAGLMIWCSDCDEFQVFNGNVWKNFLGQIAVSPSLPYIRICDQDWTLYNLNVSHYRNGDPIPHIQNHAEWASLTTGAYCYYNNDSTAYAATYGKLYNWYAVTDPRGLAPEGWHIPKAENIIFEGGPMWIGISDWSKLSDICLDIYTAGGKIKEAGTSHWDSPNEGAINSTGFTALPGGIRNSAASFVGAGYMGAWWSTSVNYNNDMEVMSRQLTADETTLLLVWAHKRDGLSVRCVRD